MILINPYGVLQCGYEYKVVLLYFFYINVHLLGRYHMPGSLLDTFAHTESLAHSPHMRKTHPRSFV